MDPETALIVSEQQRFRDLVNHEGWPLVRKIFTEKVLELQNAFNIEDGTPEKMLIDLQARKLASSWLFDILRTIEGEAQASVENTPDLDNNYIVKV